MFCLKDYVLRTLIFLFILSLTSVTHATLIDGFEDGDYTTAPTWTSYSGTNTVTNAQAKTGTYSLNVKGEIGTAYPKDANGNYSAWVYFVTDGTAGEHTDFVIQKPSASGFQNDYIRIGMFGNGLVTGYERIGGSLTSETICSAGCITNGNWYYVVIDVNDTLASSYIYDVGGTKLGENIGRTVYGNDVNAIFLAGETNVNGYYDDVSFVVTGEPATPTIPPATDANFSWSIRKDLNKIILKDTSTDTNATITDWNWIINGTLASNNQDYNHSAVQLTDYNTCLYVYDDSNMLTASQECYTISTGDWQAPTISVIATQRTNRTDANIVFTCSDNNSGCNKLFYQIDSNGWMITSITTGNFQTIYGGGAGSHTIYYLANDNNDNNSTQQTYTYTLTPDNIAPTLDYEISGGYGFTTDFNIEFSLTCYDNRLDDLNYKVFINDTNLVFNKMDANATTNYSSVIVGANQAITFKFQCVDQNGNTATETAPIVYPLLFRLINEDTGAQYTPADINAYFAQIKVYSPDGNYYFDFNAPAASQAYFIAEDNTLVFEIDYKDTAQTQINRTINFSLLTDTNIGICVPTLQAFYLQRFLSNQNRNILLKNNVAKCYTMASSMDYIYDTGYVQNVYTIGKPYYLYSRTGGVESVLAFIDGTEANQYNLDTLLLSRQDLDYVVSPDMIAFAPLLNPVTGKYDLNILQIYYESAYGLNQSVNLTITFNGTTLFTYDNTSTPNEFMVSWDWSDTNLTDQNWTTMTFTITNTSGDITTLTYYVNPNGNYQQGAPINATWMAIFSIMLFILGLGIVSVDRFFGLFGALFCLICMALAAISYPVWWTFLLAASYFIILLYIIMMGKPSTNRSVA